MIVSVPCSNFFRATQWSQHKLIIANRWTRPSTSSMSNTNSLSFDPLLSCSVRLGIPCDCGEHLLKIWSKGDNGGGARDLELGGWLCSRPQESFVHTFYFILFYRGSGSREDLRSSEGISSLLPDLNFFIIFFIFRPELDWENEGSSRVWVNFRLID